MIAPCRLPKEALSGQIVEEAVEGPDNLEKQRRIAARNKGVSFLPRKDISSLQPSIRKPL
jgi:hypothetical protein